MKTILSAFTVFAVLAIPADTTARPVTLTTKLKNYRGDGAYLAIYLTDVKGALKRTLWIAGRKMKYYKYLRDWYRASGRISRRIDGLTGASVGAGRELTVTIELSDALFDAGYLLRIDASVEDLRDSPSEVVVPLTSSGAGLVVRGRRYVRSFAYDM